MFEKIFNWASGGKTEESTAQNSNERANEIIPEILGRMTVSRSNDEQAILEKGGRLDMDEGLKAFYQEAKELLKSSDLEFDVKNDLEKMVSDVENEYNIV